MNETDTGIDREAIPFSIPANILTPNTFKKGGGRNFRSI